MVIAQVRIETQRQITSQPQRKLFLIAPWPLGVIESGGERWGEERTLEQFWKSKAGGEMKTSETLEVT